MTPMHALQQSQALYLKPQPQQQTAGAISVEDLLARTRSGDDRETPMQAKLDVTLHLEPEAQRLNPSQISAWQKQLQAHFKGQDVQLRIAGGPGNNVKDFNSALLSIRRVQAVAAQIREPGQKVELKYDPKLEVGTIKINARQQTKLATGKLAPASS
jgi:hypothetical protein